MAEQHEKALVPQIRFTGFTDPWEQRKLGELASKRIEKNTNGIKETFTNSAEHGVVSQLDYFDHDITNDANIGNYSVVHPDDFIYNPRISAVAPCGPINRNKLDRNGVMSPLYTVFSVDDTIDKLYLEHYFKTSRWHQFMFLEGNSGARSDRFSISDSIFFEMPIQCPVLEEQELIASFFGRLDSLITLHQRKYDKLCVLKKSMLDKMFPKGGSLYPEIRFAGFTDPWEQRKLGELTESYSGGTPAAGESEFYGGSIPFIRSAEIAAESTELFLTEKGYESSSARMVKPGDVLYALYGATSGEVAVSRQKGAINQAILAILPRDDCDARYITAWLRKQKGYIVTTYLQGGQGNLSGVIVKNLEVFIPSLPEQQKIGFMLSHLDSLITLHQRKLELLRNIKKSMLDKMFV
ncbi:restriction endonuclease subunit S [Bifidobacterium adolescentis]|uniref:restriction endonuclease subunit S n=3 Tax=Bifidobacterium adolescentis TaxID=1680 RepID=UPI0032C19604